MKFCADWLSELGGLSRAPAEVAAALTRVGLAVDGVEGDGPQAVLDVDVPSNRPDCLGHRGLAREACAAFGSRLPSRPARQPGAGDSGAAALQVAIDDPALCSRYCAVVVRGVRVGTSPDWMRRRLERGGVRPRNVVVDITNYVMLESGQPLHAFDLERVRGPRLAVRRARSAETLVTLDGTTRTLTADHLVIADASAPVALAGVMGGLESEIRDSTREVVIESARFDPLSVRRTARALGIRTDASQRFERGTDPEGALAAALHAAELLSSLAGATGAPQVADLFPGRIPGRRLRMRHARLQGLLGTAVEPDTAASILERLEFGVLRSDREAVEVEVPSFRVDVSGEEDLVEEVARHRGYDSIPSTLPPPVQSPAVRGGTAGERLPTIFGTLRAHGLSEAICTVFVAGAENALFADGDGAAVRLLNPLGGAGEELRRSLLPGLLASVRHNQSHGARGVALYETGVVFRAGADGRSVEEEPRLALAAAGAPAPESWDRPATPLDLFDVKGALEEALERGGWPELVAAPAAVEYLAPGRAARLSCGERSLGFLGALHPDSAQALGLAPGVTIAEVSLEVLAGIPCAPRRLRPIPRTPSISRDLALVVPRSQGVAEVLREVRGLDERIAHARVFDRYESERLGADQVGLGLRVVYHHPERTLVTEEVEEIESRVLRRLRERFRITLRSS